MKLLLDQGSDPEIVLGDDFGEGISGSAGTSQRITVELEDFDRGCIVDKVPLALADFQAQFPRGNVLGQFVFTATTSFETREDAWDYLLEMAGLVNEQRKLTFTHGTPERPNAAVWIMDNAVLERVQRVRDKSDGPKLCIRYTFGITTIVSST